MRTLWTWAVVGLLVVGLGCKSEPEEQAAPTEGAPAAEEPPASASALADTGIEADVLVTQDAIFFRNEKLIPLECKIGGQACKPEDHARQRECEKSDAACDPAEVERLNTMYFYVDDRFKKDQNDKEFLIEDLYRALEAERETANERLNETANDSSSGNFNEDLHRILNEETEDANDGNPRPPLLLYALPLKTEFHIGC
jgi:hypothetical protein